MRENITHTLVLSLLLALPACFDSDELPAPCETSDTGEEELRDLSFEPGTLFGPCTDDAEWGCEGEQGFGLACMRPVSDRPVSVCVPQTEAPAIYQDCDTVLDPTALDPSFGLGVIEHASGAYCVVWCEEDEDCGHGKACSPASNMCAWLD